MLDMSSSLQVSLRDICSHGDHNNMISPTLLSVQLLSELLIFFIIKFLFLLIFIPLAELSGIFVKSIAEGSTAAVDGRLRINDQIIEV